MPHVVIGPTTIPVEIASSSEEITKGLANRRSLEASRGMLFIFDHSGILKFWMRGMRFPLDIIWISDQKKIVDIKENVPVLSFLQRPVLFAPSEPAQYVLEVNAFFCKEYGIQIGDRVEIEQGIV